MATQVGQTTPGGRSRRSSHRAHVVQLQREQEDTDDDECTVHVCGLLCLGLGLVLFTALVIWLYSKYALVPGPWLSNRLTPHQHRPGRPQETAGPNVQAASTRLQALGLSLPLSHQALTTLASCIQASQEFYRTKQRAGTAASLPSLHWGAASASTPPPGPAGAAGSASSGQGGAAGSPEKVVCTQSACFFESFFRGQQDKARQEVLQSHGGSDRGGEGHTSASLASSSTASSAASTLPASPSTEDGRQQQQQQQSSAQEDQEADVQGELAELTSRLQDQERHQWKVAQRSRVLPRPTPLPPFSPPPSPAPPPPTPRGLRMASRAPPLAFPSKLAQMGQGPLPDDLLPWHLAGSYRRGTRPLEPLVDLHWVVTTCERRQWGRMLSSTLLSGVFNGLFPRTISIVYCKPFPMDDPTSIPSLLYNLRHSHAVNIFFVSPALKSYEKTAHSSVLSTYATALMVPHMLDAEHLPLLITEDDVVFAPDANARIASAIALTKKGDVPGLWDLYEPQNPQPARRDWDQARDDEGDTKLAHEGRTITLKWNYPFGTQAMMYNPLMTALLCRKYLHSIMNAVATDNLQDMLGRYWFHEMWRCNTHGSSCFLATVYPSIVQHIGTSSALFNEANGSINQRFHSATNFPVRVKFPGFEQEGLWRRRRGRNS